ncbi:calcium-activated potassium channel alpha chain [Anaeramoeba flamelloides]|uniref:Calcium-activated potassium channel alpha chain n=1 Tax=Anaeramoeba flamelloides TaxID=1746091 RepID=A0ABQ8Y3R0_9EUKA|nr:calcium-activated potassium channel alpha chain [Anaeramoeba flamelloides]
MAHQIEPLQLSILTTKKLSKEVQTILGHPFFDRSCKVLKGSSIISSDLSRISIKNANACFILADKYNLHSIAHDSANIMRTIAIKNSRPNLRTYTQIMTSQKKKNLNYVNVDGLIGIKKLKMKMITLNCFYPGTSTLLTNLVQEYEIEKGQEFLTKWKKEYCKGLSQTIYTIVLPHVFNNKTFSEAAEILYSHLSIILFAIVMKDQESGQRECLLNPSDSYYLKTGDVAYVIANSISKVRKVSNFTFSKKKQLKNDRSQYPEIILTQQLTYSQFRKNYINPILSNQDPLDINKNSFSIREDTDVELQELSLTKKDELTQELINKNDQDLNRSIGSYDNIYEDDQNDQELNKQSKINNENKILELELQTDTTTSTNTEPEMETNRERKLENENQDGFVNVNPKLLLKDKNYIQNLLNLYDPKRNLLRFEKIKGQLNNEAKTISGQNGEEELENKRNQIYGKNQMERDFRKFRKLKHSKNNTKGNDNQFNGKELNKLNKDNDQDKVNSDNSISKCNEYYQKNEIKKKIKNIKIKSCKNITNHIILICEIGDLQNFLMAYRKKECILYLKNEKKKNLKDFKPRKIIYVTKTKLKKNQYIELNKTFCGLYNVFFLYQSPYNLEIWKLLNIENAKHIILLPNRNTEIFQKRSPNFDNEFYKDSDLIFLTKNLLKFKHCPRLTVEIIHPNNLIFLTKQSPLHENISKQETRFQQLEFSKFFPNYHLNQIFSSGQIFTEAFFDALLMHTYFKPDLFHIIKKLTNSIHSLQINSFNSSQLFMKKIPKQFLNKTFSFLFNHLLKNEQNLAIGLLRSVNLNKLGNVSPYVYTNPNPKTTIFKGDYVYILGKIN